MRGRRTGRAAVCGLIVLALAGACTRGSTSSRPPIHVNPNMDHQPKALPQSESTFFYDGSTNRQPLPGTVARGELHADAAYYTGGDAAGAPVGTSPMAVDEALLARGADRFRIYCSPCHGEKGNGKGLVATRASIPAADLLQDRVRQMADGQLFQTITAGVGLMPSFASRLPVEDRWAIVAHVRELENR